MTFHMMTTVSVLGTREFLYPICKQKAKRLPLWCDVDVENLPTDTAVKNGNCHKNFFSLIYLLKTYILGTRQNRLAEAVLL